MFSDSTAEDTNMEQLDATKKSTEENMDWKRALPKNAGYVRDISDHAFWTLSSCKTGFLYAYKPFLILMIHIFFEDMEILYEVFQTDLVFNNYLKIMWISIGSQMDHSLTQ